MSEPLVSLDETLGGPDETLLEVDEPLIELDETLVEFHTPLVEVDDHLTRAMQTAESLFRIVRDDLEAQPEPRLRAVGWVGW